MIRTRKGMSTIAALALTGATALGGAITGGALVGAGVAHAATPTPSVYNATVSQTSPYYPYGGNGAIAPGGVHQEANGFVFYLNNDFAPGEQIAITVGSGSTADSGAATCESATDWVAFDQTPTLNVESWSYSAGQAPIIQEKLTTAKGDPTACNGVKDELLLTIVNPAIGNTSSTDSWRVDVGTAYEGAVFYSVGSGTSVDASGNPIGIAATDTPTGASATPLSISPNAGLEPFVITTQAPAAGLQDGQQGSIGPVTVAELSGDNFAAGAAAGTGGQEQLCVEDGNSWNGSTTITATNTQVSLDPATGFADSITVDPSPGQNGGSCYIFYVEPTASNTTKPASLTTGDLSVTADAYPGPQVIHMYDDQAGQALNTAGFSITAADRIAGATADDTAIASFNDTFGPNGECLNRTDGLAPVVLANDAEPYDSLSANFLAANLNTGLLITPSGSLPTNLLNLLRNDGVGTVYIVGGTLVVSQAVQNQLAATPAYEPGGTTPAVDANGKPIMIQVVRIGGQTADDTSSMVDQYLGYFAADSISPVPGAYGNAYNDTAGTESAAPSPVLDLRTVIVTTDTNYQDAVSAATMSYGNYLPIVLTPSGTLSAAAQNTILNLGAQQAIVMGGPLAVSDNVVNSLQGLGVSVLRIAGTNFGDTSQMLAQFEVGGYGTGLEYSECGQTYVGSARGDGFTDALTSAEVMDGYPLLLTNSPSTIDSSVESLLAQGGSFDGIGTDNAHITYITVFGGVLAQTPALVQQEINDIASGIA